MVLEWTTVKGLCASAPRAGRGATTRSPSSRSSSTDSDSVSSTETSAGADCQGFSVGGGAGARRRGRGGATVGRLTGSCSRASPTFVRRSDRPVVGGGSGRGRRGVGDRVPTARTPDLVRPGGGPTGVETPSPIRRRGSPSRPPSEDSRPTRPGLPPHGTLAPSRAHTTSRPGGAGRRPTLSTPGYGPTPTEGRRVGRGTCSCPLDTPRSPYRAISGPPTPTPGTPWKPLDEPLR